MLHELRGGPELGLEQALRRLSPCDLVLVEGYKAFPMPKLEVWRERVGKPLLHPQDPCILALATDSPDALPADTSVRLPVFPLSDYDIVATFVIDKATAGPVDD